jgi:beta-galactosidase
VRGERVELVIDRRAASLATFAWEGEPLLVAGPVATLWRAPTDNDGLKQGWMRGLQGRLGEWLRLGLDRLERQGVAVEWREAAGGALRVRLDAELAGADPAVRARHRQELVIEPSGVLRLVEAIDVPKAWDDVPRVGVVLALPAVFERLEWLGLGPHETYPDRRASGRVGRFASTVAEELAPYVVPQEHGHHAETRWLALSTGGGLGVRIAGARRFGFSASRFRAEDLFAARHATELVPRDETVLHLDAAHRGLGTASCGPDVLPRWRIRPGRHRLAWTLTPLRERPIPRSP